jgi:hypothetical protein
MISGENTLEVPSRSNVSFAWRNKEDLNERIGFSNKTLVGLDCETACAGAAKGKEQS